ncbi:MAG TPA: hypothetical protein PKW49_06275 [Paludibacteraceae bacterium]|nr:hypothetical protein [Paludibacteraceae bacterium]HQF50065.1 hypothetical protein [Paludibacteraceae bacterium]HQJ89290.1 hypothetical protein [Paludibacteraceae bacterium]
MRAFCLLFFLLNCFCLSAQDQRFDGTIEKQLFFSGNQVKVEADSAYMVSKKRAAAINQRLDELDSLRSVCSVLMTRNNALSEGLSQTYNSLLHLKDELDKDADIQNRHLSSILNDLDKTNADLKSNNLSLKGNNEDFSTQIKELDSVVKKLKRETRWIWWNGCADKVVAFAAGIGVGVLVCVLVR